MTGFRHKKFYSPVSTYMRKTFYVPTSLKNVGTWTGEPTMGSTQQMYTYDFLCRNLSLCPRPRSGLRTILDVKLVQGGPPLSVKYES